MVFCNNFKTKEIYQEKEVTILILIDGFLQYGYSWTDYHKLAVTILILIDGFLQCTYYNMYIAKESHNPYFNRWFSAIAAKISQNFTFLCKKLVFSDSFCELYFTQPLYINYCTNYLNTFLLKLAKIKAIINII